MEAEPVRRAVEGGSPRRASRGASPREEARGRASPGSSPAEASIAAATRDGAGRCVAGVFDDEAPRRRAAGYKPARPADSRLSVPGVAGARHARFDSSPAKPYRLRGTYPFHGPCARTRRTRTHTMPTSPSPWSPSPRARRRRGCSSLALRGRLRRHRRLASPRRTRRSPPSSTRADTTESTRRPRARPVGFARTARRAGPAGGANGSRGVGGDAGVVRGPLEARSSRPGGGSI